MQIGENRRDMIETRFLGNNTCEGILNKLETSQVGTRCAGEKRVTVVKP